VANDIAVLPILSELEIKSLCNLEVDIPDVKVQILSHPKEWYHDFHRGKHVMESREDYSLSVVRALEALNCNNFKTISQGDYALNFADGQVALRVFRGLMPPPLTQHFRSVAQSYLPSCQTLHLGAKEYNPSANTEDYKNLILRKWIQDKGISKEHTVAMLPELLFADFILCQVAKDSYEKKLEVDTKYRLAQTCFSRIAINSTNCKLHRDRDIGLDVLIYAGEWAMGGHLVIPQFGISIEVQPGDVVVMDSCVFHKATDFEGTRYVAVFFTKNHHEVSSSNNVLRVDDEMVWLSQKMFNLFS